jgi:hypothetical protein
MNDRLFDSRVSPKDDLGETGAPGNEIEITQEMIEAGMVALLNSEWRYDECNASDAVTLVYRAMALGDPNRKVRQPYVP